jgi:hypothetical protein
MVGGVTHQASAGFLRLRAPEAVTAGFTRGDMVFSGYPSQEKHGRSTVLLEGESSGGGSGLASGLEEEMFAGVNEG